MTGPGSISYPGPEILLGGRVDTAVSLLALICLLTQCIALAQACKIKACYYNNYATLRPSRYKVFPEMLNPHLCTHMIYAFAHIANNKLIAAYPMDEDSPWKTGLYTRFNNLKKNNTSLLTLLSVGRWDFGVKEFIQMASTPENRKTFIDHAIVFLRDRNFDGLDLRWEHPTGRGGTYRDKTNYSLLIKAFSKSFEAINVDPPVPGDEPVKVIMPYKNPYPFPPYAPRSFHLLTKDELNEKCKNTTGEVKLPYEGIDCWAHILCLNGVGSMDNCPYLQRLDLDSRQCFCFLSFCLNSEDFNCSSVYISVNPISSSLNKFCGCTKMPVDIQSVGHLLKIVFSTNQGIKGNQFVLSYRFKSPCGEQNLRTAPGNIRSAGYHDIDLDPFPCKWNMSAPVGERIRLKRGHPDVCPRSGSFSEASASGQPKVVKCLCIIDTIQDGRHIDSCDVKVFSVSIDFQNWSEVSQCDQQVISEGNYLSILHILNPGRQRIEFDATYDFEGLPTRMCNTGVFSLVVHIDLVKT
ncbi:hypothetical protein Btru_050504, partial [Bulinus truncatus]